MKQKTTQKIIISILSVFGLAFFISGVQAQEAESNTVEFPGPSITASETVEGTVNCFDYYKFGSVQVDVESEIGTTVPGVPMSFKGTIKNDNDYPIVDGQVYVKVFRKQANLDKAHANGFFLQDQFFVEENISLNAKENKTITFEWKIPNYALPGEYQIATFFTSAKKFNLLGLSFTDDVVGNTFNFTVKGESTKNVEFNKNTVKVNDKDYHFAAFPPRLTKDEDITIKTDLVNSTKTTQSIPVTWTLYSWDGLEKEKIINTKKETISLNSGETKNISYTIQNKDYPVYFLVAEADYKDTKSMLDIRTVRQDVNRTRINFPAVTSYPFKQNEKNTLFVCAHNSGTADMVDNNKLIITLLDENQKEIHKYAYEGKISGAMMGLKDDFVPKENYESFYIKSELFTDGQLVDSATMKYDCPKLTPGKCAGKGLSAQTTEAASQEKEKSALFTPIVVGLIFLLIGILAIVFYKKKQMNKVGIFLVAILVSGFMFHVGVNRAEAKSVQWSQAVSGTFDYEWSWNGTTNGSWVKALANPNFSIIYNAKVKNNATGAEITDGSSLPTGTVLKFEPAPFADTDIYWFGTGYSSDSPYGHWINNAANTGNACNSQDFVNNAIGLAVGYYNFPGCKPLTMGLYRCPYSVDVFIPFSVNPPVISISQSGTADLSCSGMVCTVNSAGTIIPTFNFSATYGKLYYRYQVIYFGSSYYPPNCSYSTKPLRTTGVSSDYIQTVPAQTITYNLTVVATNNPPAAPAITGPITGNTDTSYSFTAFSTDPDGDALRYGFDWDNDNTVDQWVPAAGYVSSGTIQTAGYTWTTIGAKTFKALAQDDKGNSSGWTSHIINIIACVSDYSNYYCTASSADCDASNCGETLNNLCFKSDRNSCPGAPPVQVITTDADYGNCSCGPIICPDCPSDNNWREVAP